MAAALTIAVLLAFSVATVRIAGVMMRLTGLTESVARFQCLSALTGTGFTTGESEMIVNYPIRRRILVALMIIGNLGLVSIGSTFIVAFVNASSESDAILAQGITIIGAILVVLLITLFKPLDRIMCDFIGKILMKTTSLGKRRYKRVLQLDNGYSIAEHSLQGSDPEQFKTKLGEKNSLVFLAVRQGSERKFYPFSGSVELEADDVLVCFGSDDAHDIFEDKMGDV